MTDKIEAAKAELIALGIDKECAKEQLERYLDYGVPLKQAVLTIRRHYGKSPSAPTRSPVEQAGCPNCGCTSHGAPTKRFRGYDHDDMGTHT